MIEIYADYFYNNTLQEEHVYLDEAQIALVSKPIFYEKSSKYRGEYVDTWRFAIVIAGASHTFSYLNQSDCETWYKMTKESWMDYLNTP